MQGHGQGKSEDLARERSPRMIDGDSHRQLWCVGKFSGHTAEIDHFIVCFLLDSGAHQGHPPRSSQHYGRQRLLRFMMPSSTCRKQASTGNCSRVRREWLRPTVSAGYAKTGGGFHQHGRYRFGQASPPHLPTTGWAVSTLQAVVATITTKRQTRVQRPFPRRAGARRRTSRATEVRSRR